MQPSSDYFQWKLPHTLVAVCEGDFHPERAGLEIQTGETAPL